MRKTGLALTASLALLAPSAASAADLCVGAPSNCPGGGSVLANLQTALDMTDNAADSDRIFVGGTQIAPTTGGFVYSNAAGPVDIAGDGTAVITSQPMSTSTLSVNALAAGSSVHDLTVRIPANVPNSGNHFATNADADAVTVNHDPAQTTDQITGVVLNGGADFTDGSVTTPPSQNGNMNGIRAASAGSTIARSAVDGTNGVSFQGTGVVDRVDIDASLTGVVGYTGSSTVKSSLIKVSGTSNGPSGVAVYNNGASSLTVSDSTVVHTGAAPAGSWGLLVNAFNNNAASPASLTANNVVVSGFGHDRGTLAAALPTADLTVTNSRYDASTDNDTAPNGTMSPAAGTLGASNTSAAPGFVSGSDFHLTAASALIDAGDPGTGAGLDFDGNTLLFDGNGDCVARRDIGAFERQSGSQPCPQAQQPGGTTQPGGSQTPAQPSIPTGPAQPKDTTKPRFSGLGLRKRVLSFKLSEQAKLSIEIKKGRKTVKRMALTGKSGANKVRLPKLGRGRYKASIKATDTAGNAGSKAKAFTVR